MSSGYLSEIFQSIQGEGIYVGQRQIFVRFSGCNLSCEYCDTPSHNGPDDNKFCTVTVNKDPEKVLNPIDGGTLKNILDKFPVKEGFFHSISFTGGEPLMQVDFLKDVLPGVRLRRYLETNGTMPERLEEVIEDVDIIAMDIKLPSATKSGPYLAQHRKFLSIASKKEVFVKIVYSKDSTAKEIDEASKLISEINSAIPLVLQPATASRHYKEAPSPDQSLSFQSIGKKHLKNVLVIPQTHKIMGLA